MRRALLVGVCLLALGRVAAALPDNKIVHTVQFRTWPAQGVWVEADGWRQPAERPVSLDYTSTNEKRVVLQLPGFEDAVVNVTGQDAARGTFPATGDPIQLRADNIWIGATYWGRDHALGLLFSGLGLALVGWRMLAFWKSQRQYRSRLAEYQAQRDRSDSLLLTRLDGYLLVARLGQGGMATVYRGLPADTLDESQSVAVKILARELFADQEFRQRFRREVTAYQRLSHMNIVRVLSWKEADDSGDAPYIILEFVAGTTLSQAIPGGGMSWSQAAPLLEQIFAAVDFAHRQGVVHRDLKPDNIMVDHGRVKIMDFGLARNHDASELTVSGTVLGTPSYMAPEQLSAGSAAPAVDQYSLGVIVYRLLSNRLPHEAPDLMQLLSKVASAAPVPLDSYQPHLAGPLSQAVMRMLSRSPEERYASVSQAWSALCEAAAA